MKPVNHPKHTPPAPSMGRRFRMGGCGAAPSGLPSAYDQDAEQVRMRLRHDIAVATRTVKTALRRLIRTGSSV
jgi:hypothetical protein